MIRIFLLLLCAANLVFAGTAIGNDDNLPPAPKWKLKCNGDVTGATVTDMPDDPQIRVGLKSIVFDDAQSYNYDFEYEDFEPGKAYTTIWRLKIKDVRLDAKAVITFSDTLDNDTTIVIKYTSIKLGIDPAYYDFGKIPFNTESSSQFTVTNLSDMDPVILNQLKFKYDNQNFDISGISLPYPLGPGESVNFDIKLSGSKQGTFADSVIVGDTCVSYSAGYVTGIIGGAEIKVTDADFGDLTVLDSKLLTVEITNPGVADLKIEDVIGPAQSQFTIENLPVIDTGNPLILEPGENQSFDVRFTPDLEQVYNDTIKFVSNAKIIDSICVLSGRGIKPGLAAEGFDWKRRRIYRAAHPAGPYPSDAGYGIKLSNTGSQEVMVNGIIIKSDIKGSAFIFDRNIFNNIKIPAGKDTVISVDFKPESVGVHKLILQFDNNADSETEAVLTGIGILPRLETDFQDIDFGTTNIDDFANPSGPNKPVIFRNTKWNDPDDSSVDVSDSLVITSFEILPTGVEIIDDGSGWGTEGFRFNKNAIEHSDGSVVGLPIVLYPGEYITIPADYVARHSGQHEASLKTVSDAENDPVSNWSGKSIGNYLSTTGGNVKICANETAEIDCIIKNNSPDPIDITSIDFSNSYPELYFKNPPQQNGFTLNPDQPETVTIVFQPSAAGTFNTELVFNNSSPDNPAKASISAEAVFHKISVDYNPIKERFPVGEVFHYKVNLNEYKDINIAAVKKVSVSLYYRSHILAEIPDRLKAASGFGSGYEVSQPVFETLSQANKIEKISFDITAFDNNFINGDAEIIATDFMTVLPIHQQGTTVLPDFDTIAIISTEIEAVDFRECTFYDIANTIINILPVCAFNIGKIKYSGNNFFLKNISPNPAEGDKITVDFSTGFDADTKIEIINTIGEIISESNFLNLEAGSHTVSIDLNGSNSGLYYIRMRSGPFMDVKKFIISR